MLTHSNTIKATLFVFIVLLVIDYYRVVPVGFYFLLLILSVSITALGSFLIQWNYHFISFNSNNETLKNQVAITFDDGPSPEFTPQVLEILEAHNAKATFFCVGKNIEQSPELLKKIINKGHTIGNHTYSHANNFGFFKTSRVISELNKTNNIIKELTNLNIKLYRPAFGVTNPRIKRALIKTGLQSIGWNKRSLDTTSLNTNVILNRVTKNLKKGDVILLHDTNSKSILVLEQLLLILQNKNLQPVTIDCLFNIEPYA